MTTSAEGFNEGQEPGRSGLSAECAFCTDSRRADRRTLQCMTRGRSRFISVSGQFRAESPYAAANFAPKDRSGAAESAGERVERGDVEGAAVWRRIRRVLVPALAGGLLPP